VSSEGKLFGIDVIKISKAVIQTKNVCIVEIMSSEIIPKFARDLLIWSVFISKTDTTKAFAKFSGADPLYLCAIYSIKAFYEVYVDSASSLL
jgi:hypothetical protein